MDIQDRQADITLDTPSNLFCREFCGLNGSADFYAPDLKSSQKRGALSLKVFLDMCREDGVEPSK
jgi:predicted HicB family RNase H-like nuclease